MDAWLSYLQSCARTIWNGNDHMAIIGIMVVASLVLMSVRKKPQ